MVTLSCRRFGLGTPAVSSSVIAISRVNIVSGDVDVVGGPENVVNSGSRPSPRSAGVVGRVDQTVGARRPQRLRAIQEHAEVRHVPDLRPGDDAGVARGVHAFDRLARLLTGGQAEGRARQVAEAEREHARQAEQSGREDGHGDHGFDQREAAVAARRALHRVFMSGASSYSTHALAVPLPCAHQRR